MFSSLGQEIARLIMEQEKKEYKKIREREKEKEKEKERDRERAAMERRRHEGDYRVTFHTWRLFHVICRVKCLCRLGGHIKVFFHCGNGTIILGTMNFFWFPAPFGGRGPAQNSR